MFEVRFIDSISPDLSKIPSVSVGFQTRKLSINFAYVLVEDDGVPVMIINVPKNREDYYFREEVLIWNNNVVVGIGEQLAMVRLDNFASTNIDLGCYFGYFYPYDAGLLVASSDELYCIEADQSVRWKSPPLGIDGVVVESVEGNVVKGLGEWDPPGGWLPFSIELEFGRLIPNS